MCITIMMLTIKTMMLIRKKKTEEVEKDRKEFRGLIKVLL